MLVKVCLFTCYNNQMCEHTIFHRTHAPKRISYENERVPWSNAMLRYDPHCSHPLFFSVKVHRLKGNLGICIQCYQVRLPETSLHGPICLTFLAKQRPSFKRIYPRPGKYEIKSPLNKQVREPRPATFWHTT